MKKILYISLVMLAGLSSCNDALDVTPKNKVGIDDYFKTASDLQLFTNYFYDAVMDNAMSNENWGFDAQDDCKVNRNLSAVMKAGTNRTVPNSGGGWSWGALRRMNTFLEYRDLAISNGVPVAEVEKYEAVTRFFRAYFYFKKVQRFGDVPWIDRQMESNDPGLYYARDSREYIMQKMLKDIDFAIEKLPAKEKEAAAPYRVTKGAALALKSCFCLFEGTFRKYHNLDIPAGTSASGEAYETHDWKYYLEQSVDASEKLMSGTYGKYKLFTTGKPASDYTTLFAQQDASKDEYILSVKYDQGIKILHNANAHALQPSQGSPGYTRKFVCSYLMKDGTRFTDKPGWQTMIFKDEMADRDPRLAQSIRGLGYHRFEQTEILPANYEGSVTGYHPHKFVGATGDNGSWDRNNSSSNDLPEFRYGEILLNLAEAKAELETLTQADLDKTVNELRKRVGMTGMLNLANANANPDPYLDGDISPESGYFNVTGSNKGVILEIRRERAIELVQEGRRWYDLMRWKCGKMIDQPLTGNYFPGPGKYDLTGDGKPNLILYANGDAKPAAENDAVVWEIGKNITLTETSYGYTNYHVDQKIQKFNEARDYLYPIPSDEIRLNPNLKQNPEWK